MKVIGVVTLIVSALVGCGPGVPTQDLPTSNTTRPITFTDENNNTITPISKVEGTGLNPPHGQPGHRCDIRAGEPLNSKPAPSTFTTPVTIPGTQNTNPIRSYTAPFVNPDLKAATNPASYITPSTQPADGLNPPHGQPGHRCDIQVGQPLNGKPSPATTNTTSPTVTPAANSVAVAPGMNPKHGQPGHRCDIMVGQPLNSKPTLPSATNSTPSPVITPATNTATVAPGLNPRHGQPGHRCDILVGQPLNTPVKTANDSTES